MQPCIKDKMLIGAAILTAVLFNLCEQVNTAEDFAPTCRAGICDDRPECPRTTCSCIYPSKVDCAVYYQCIGGKPKQYKCSPGLLLNPLTLTCDYDFNVNCSLGTRTTTDSTTVVPTTIAPVTRTEALTTTETPTTITEAPTTTTEAPTTTTTTEAPTTTTEAPTTTTTTEAPTTTTEAPTTTTEAPTTTTTKAPTTTEAPTTTTTTTTEAPTTTTKAPTTTEAPTTTTEAPTTTTETPTTTTRPPSFSCPEYYGLFPDPKNCRRFYHCTHYKPIHKWCPSNLHWNPELLVCDYPYRAGCGSSPPTSTVTSTTEITTTSTQPTPVNATCDCDYCVMPVPNDCRSFVVCKDRIPSFMQCEHGLYFNAMTGTCDDPENVNCKPEAQCPGNDGRFPLPDSCSYFLDCRNATKSIQKCPEGLYFDEISQNCDWIGTCQGIPYPPPPPMQPMEGETCPCNYCLIRDPEDCSSYFVCRYQELYRGKCAGGLQYNHKGEVCDYDYNVQCQNPTVPVASCPKESGYFPFPGDCNLYIHCTKWTPNIRECPGNLHFNPSKMSCDYPWNAGCDSDVDPTPEPSPELIACDCDCCVEPDSMDCSTFTVCIDNVGVRRKCSSGLLFNPITENCDFEENVECSEPVTNISLPECPEDQSLIPYPYDCNIYFQCINGNAYVRYCPGNLHFNPQRKVCDWPEKAGCSGGPTDEPSTVPPQRPCDVCESCFIPNKYDCSVYTYCDEGTAYEMSCSDGLFYNPEIEDCDLASHVNCSTHHIEECPEPSGLFPIGDCSSYVLCSNGIPYKKNCAPGLYFNAASHVCDWSDNSNCGGEPVQPSTPSPLRNCSCDCCFIADENDCSTFFLCLHGEMSSGHCSSGLLFNPVTENCDFPQHVNCFESSPVCLSPDGLFPDANDCSSYYRCSNGNARKRDCTSGMHFSKDAGQCEDPCAAKCDDAADCNLTTTTASTTTVTTPRPTTVTTPKPTTVPTTNPTTVTTPIPTTVTTPRPTTVTTPRPTTVTTPKPISHYCKDINGLNPNLDDCGSFYYCFNGNAYLITCPDGLHYSAEHHVCESPCDAKCDLAIDCNPTTTTPRPTTVTTPRPTTVTTARPTTVTTPRPTTVTTPRPTTVTTPRPATVTTPRPTTVTTPRPTTVTTPRPTTDTTPRPTTVTTPRPTTVTPPRPSTTITTPSPYCKDINGLNPNPEDCGSFYNCSMGNAYLIKCPDGLHYSAEHHLCERPCDAKCDVAIDCPPGNCSCENCYLPDPIDCSAFYHCKDRHLTLSYCPYGMLFNKATRMCDREENVECVPTGDPSMCQEPQGIFSYPGDCQKYVYCENGVAYVMSCSYGQDFNSDTGNCEEGHGACGPTTINPHCLTPTGLFPHENNCSLFYQCDHGIAYTKVCPSPLYFNKRLEVCDWPSNVICNTGTTTFNPHCPTPTGMFPHESNCNLFYHCDHGRAHIKKCPSYLHFNDRLKVCDYPRNVNCVRASPKSAAPSTSTTPELTCDIVPGVICPCACRVPTYDDCHTFYQCLEDGTACKRTCPSGLYYNKRKMMCDLPANVECRDFFFSMLKQKQAKPSSSYFYYNHV